MCIACLGRDSVAQPLIHDSAKMACHAMKERQQVLGVGMNDIDTWRAGLLFL